MRVLIVDDSLLAGHALKSYFVKLGHEVITLARDGNMGKQMFLSEKPDLVTIDAVMPGMNGQELIKFINEEDSKNSNKTKILMISSDEISAEDKSKMTVSKYIVKPVTFAKIEEAINSL